MSKELEELVEFLHHGNTQIRQIACENLVAYSSSQPSIFKTGQLLPVRDLKLLVRDYGVGQEPDSDHWMPTAADKLVQPIAKNALTILINLSSDEEVLKNLAEDDAYLESLLSRVTNVKETNANEISMLLANLAKSDSLKRLIPSKRAIPKPMSESSSSMDQLMDCFVKGAEGKVNKAADFDYLAYFFADISKYKEGRSYFTTRQAYDSVVPITKLTVFTEHSSHVRRKGVALTIKNVAFDVDSQPMLLDEDGANLLPYVLLPLAGSEEFPDSETATMLPDLQLLPPDKARDSDPDILISHLETLLLLTSSREAREKMREVQVYPIVRECHLHVENEGVREACDRLVQVLMRDEAGDEGDGHEEHDEDDDKIVEIF